MTKEAKLSEYLLRLRIYTSTKYIQKHVEKEASQKIQADGIPIPDGLIMKQVVGHFNPLPDGNCNFRALTHAIIGDQEQYKLLKAKMIAFSSENVFYQQIFGSPQSSKPSPGTFESIMNKLCNEASLDSQDHWFQFPGMVQLAADTFSRAIACYTPDQQSTLLFRSFSNSFHSFAITC
ncbi:hypothetical protein G6F42_014265 [Rhizopus arrhizus]|nr:hypothetical protein G6F42_014265 [Rhizopus arrhizus]